MRSITPSSAASLVRHVALEGAETVDRLVELVVGEGGQVGEQVVELLEVGGPLALLVGRHLQGEVARRRVPAGPAVGEDLRAAVR